MSREQVERVVGLYRLFNEGRFEEALQQLPDDIDWVVLELLPDQGPYRGREGVRRFWQTWRETFDDFRIDILEAHDLGEQVLVIMRVGGTGKDSGIDVGSPAFPAVWTWRDGDIDRMEMFMNEEAAREAIGRDWKAFPRRGERSP